MRCIVRKNRVTGILKQAGFFHDSDFPALPVRVIVKTGQFRDKMSFGDNKEHQQGESGTMEFPKSGGI